VLLNAAKHAARATKAIAHRVARRPCAWIRRPLRGGSMVGNGTRSVPGGAATACWIPPAFRR